MGLLELIYRTMRTSTDKPRVVGYAAKCLGTLASKAELIQAQMYSLPNLINCLTENIEQFKQNTTVVGNLVFFLHFMTEVAGWLGKNKIVRLIDDLFALIEGGFVFKEEDKAHVGPMWKLTWTVIIQLVDTYIQYGYRDADVDVAWASRTLGIIEKNYKHWECYYALAFFSDPMGQDVLRPMADRAVKAVIKLLSWHTKGGQRCDGRLCTERIHVDKDDPEEQERMRKMSEEERNKEKEKQEAERRRRMEKRKEKRMAPPKKKPNLKRDGDWGHTIDLGVDLLINLLLTTEKDEVKATARFQALVPAALEKIDKYLVHNPAIDLAPAEGAIDREMAECFNRTGVVKLLMEIVASHIHHKNLVFKLCNLLFFITYENKGFRTDELFMEGKGPVVLLKALEEDLDDESIKQLEWHCTRFVAPLILVARKIEYKETIIASGWDVILLLLDKAFELGLQVLIYLQKGSNEVKRRMKEEFRIDHRVITYAREETWSNNPVALKQAVDLLVGIKSALLKRLTEFISPKMLVAMAYYWTPRDVGRQLLFDPNPEDTIRVVTHVLDNLQGWIKKQWDETPNKAIGLPPDLLPVLESGLVTTIATLLWSLPNDSPVWQSAVGCAFHLFRLADQGVQERLAPDWITERKKAQYTPVSLHRYKEYINHPSFDQGLWAFMESLFIPAYEKRGLDFSKEIIAPPSMMAGMQRSFGGVRPFDPNAKPPTGAFVELDPEKKRCLYCHKSGVTLQRCGQCKQAFFCDRICQMRAWTDHKQKCKKT